MVFLDAFGMEFGTGIHLVAESIIHILYITDVKVFLCLIFSLSLACSPGGFGAIRKSQTCGINVFMITQPMSGCAQLMKLVIFFFCIFRCMCLGCVCVCVRVCV